ncbi:hypothetical protein RKD27_008908 [Streptomyces sp. SAI-126]
MSAFGAAVSAFGAVVSAFGAVGECGPLTTRGLDRTGPGEGRLRGRRPA